MTELELRVDLYSLPDGQYIYHNADYSRVVRVVARDIDAYMAS